MGSSAGGIIALAISTGIPEYELQKICYKMNAIPSTDRFAEGDGAVAADDFENRLQKKSITDNLLKILDQYGVVQENTLRAIVNKITSSEEFAKAQDKLLEWLLLTSPAMG